MGTTAALPSGSTLSNSSTTVDFPAPGGPAPATITRFDLPACLKMAAAILAISDMASQPPPAAESLAAIPAAGHKLRLACPPAASYETVPAFSSGDDWNNAFTRPPGTP